MKKVYVTPEMAVSRYDVADMFTASAVPENLTLKTSIGSGVNFTQAGQASYSDLYPELFE
ncbi:MAG: hypothetical protein ACI4CT_07175 [Lachnospiraceae bacterium]